MDKIGEKLFILILFLLILPSLSPATATCDTACSQFQCYTYNSVCGNENLNCGMLYTLPPQCNNTYEKIEGVPITGISCKWAKPAVAQRLPTLYNNGCHFTLTEAFPPTVHHLSTYHCTGEAVDIVPSTNYDDICCKKAKELGFEVINELGYYTPNCGWSTTYFTTTGANLHLQITGAPPPPPTPGKCTTCEDAPIPYPDDAACDCDHNNTTKEMTGTLNWTGHKAVGSCGSEIWDASCHTNCAKSFTCLAQLVEETIIVNATTGETTTTEVCHSNWNPGSAYCKEKDGKTSWCDGTSISLGLDAAEQSYWNAFCQAPISIQINPYCWFLSQKMNAVVYTSGEMATTCLPWETATYATAPNLTCDDENCSSTAWTALTDGDCEQTFGGSPPAFPLEFQSCPLHCECWGQCMAPVTQYHYYDGEGELDWGKDCTSTYSTDWEREKCRKANEEGIKLPVSFGWEMPEMINEVFPDGKYPDGTYKYYWSNPPPSLHSDVQSLIVKIDGIEKFLTADELLNATKFKSGEVKAKKLKEFRDQCLNGTYSGEFLNFLRTWDPYLDGNRLKTICQNHDAQRLNQILYFIYFTEGGDAVGKPGSTFNYSISQDKEFGPCTLNSDKSYEWSARLCCGTDSNNCGPPSHVKEPPQTSSPYPPTSNKQFFRTSPAPEPVGILESTIVKNGWEKSKMTDVIDPYTKETIRGYIPEHFTANAIRWIDTDWNGKGVINLKEGDYVEPEWCSVTTTETFLGSDNRTYFSVGPPLYKLRVFYDDVLKLYDPITEVEEKKKEIEEKGNEVPRCENPNELGFCQKSDLSEYLKRACLCHPSPCAYPCEKEKFCQEATLSSEICYPGLGRIGSPRLEWDVRKYLGKSIDEINSMNKDELQWEVQKLVEKNCVGYVGRSAYGEKLAKEEAIIITEDPYLPLEYANGAEYKPTGTGFEWWNPLTYPKLFEREQYSTTTLGRPWSRDYEELFFSHDKPIDWQVGLVEGNSDLKEPSVYSQKWNFQLLTSPIKKWDLENQEMAEINPIKEISPLPLSEKNKTDDSTPVLNRIQTINWNQIYRALSYHLIFLNKKGEEISIPEQFSVVRTAEGKQSLFTKLDQIWSHLLNSDSKCKEDDLNCRRLDQEFTLVIQPCWDERGMHCVDKLSWVDKNGVQQKQKLSLSQKFKTTGEKPTGLDPGLDITQNPDLAIDPDKVPKKKIPRYLDWDDMPGAASYWYDITGPTSLKGEAPKSNVYADLKGGPEEEGNFTWTVRTCADMCDKEDTLQCGTSSDEMMFYGCELKPPEEYKPDIGEQFYPTENINFSWGNIKCINTEKGDFYVFKLGYSTPADCKNVKKELRDECNAIQNEDVCKEPRSLISVFPNKPLPKSSQEFFGKDKWCLGTYNWSIKGCLLDPSCHMEQDPNSKCPCGGWYMKCDHEPECGDWSPFGYFNIVLEKAPQLPTGGAGFGTCNGLIPCGGTKGDCNFTDIPKLIANIINCILWTLFPIALFGLVVYSGIVFYFSMGAPDTLEKVKSIWIAGGKGFLIMFLAWTILNLIFQVLGWQKGTFGDWFNPH